MVSGALAMQSTWLKALNSSYMQGKVIAANIRKLMNGEKLEHYEPPAAGILLTLGIVCAGNYILYKTTYSHPVFQHKNVIFRNPGYPGDPEGVPFIDMRENGQVFPPVSAAAADEECYRHLDRDIDAIWGYRHGGEDFDA